MPRRLGAPRPAPENRERRASHRPRLAGLTLCAFASATCACRPPVPGCPPNSTREECLFARGVRSASADAAGGPATSGTRSEPGTTELGPWATVDSRLRAAAEMMTAGRGPRAVDAYAQTWCAEDPERLALRDDTPAPADSWICALPEVGDSAGLPVFLEYSAGAISISTAGMSQVASAEVLAGVIARWSPLCDGPTTPVERDQPLDDFRSCQLAGGPRVVFARFARDVEADLWQVSMMLAP